MAIIRLTIRLKHPDDAALVAAIDAMPPGDRNKHLKQALEDSLIHGPTLAQAVNALAHAVEGMGNTASPPTTERPRADKAALKAALLGPFQQQD